MPKLLVLKFGLHPKHGRKAVPDLPCTGGGKILLGPGKALTDRDGSFPFAPARASRETLTHRRWGSNDTTHSRSSSKPKGICRLHPERTPVIPIFKHLSASSGNSFCQLEMTTTTTTTVLKCRFRLSECNATVLLRTRRTNWGCQTPTRNHLCLPSRCYFGPDGHLALNCW